VKKNEIAARLRCGAAPVILAAALITPALAIAQDTPQEAQEAGVGDNVIIVTGSRIARPDLAASSPVSVVTSDQLQLASKAGVEEFLRNMPQAVSGLGSNNNNGNEGTATVNLRNLGEERTLVLVDGKRFVPYDSQGIVDLNMIPASLVERVEVVTGGASAVYGSDAVAGVVNFIMKKDFQGIAGDAQYGLSEKGDGRHYDFSLTGGLNLGDRGNIVVNGTYSKQQKVTQGAREFSKFSLASADFSPGGSSTNEFGSIDLPGGLGRYTFTPNGFVPYSGARDSFNFNPFNLLQVPQEKYTATALLHYDVTDSVEFFGRASYGKTKIRTEIAPSGTFGFTFDERS
jgi:iron complex outermembrane receptor protein